VRNAASTIITVTIAAEEVVTIVIVVTAVNVMTRSQFSFLAG